MSPPCPGNHSHMSLPGWTSGVLVDHHSLPSAGTIPRIALENQPSPSVRTHSSGRAATTLGFKSGSCALGLANGH